MRLVRLEALSVPGGFDNHDAFGISPGMMWVIDGATALSPTGEDELDRFVADLNRGLRMRALSKGPLADVLADVAREMLPGYAGDREPWERPSASVAVVRVLGDRLEYLVLGDAVVAIRCGDGRMVVAEDKRVRPLDAKAVKEKLRFQREKGLTSPQARKAITQLLREHRNMMNTPEGYWVFNADPEACYRAVTGAVENARGARALLATDGFSRLVDVFKYATWEALMGELVFRSLADIVNMLRRLEVADQECLNFPRFAIYDDSTAIYFECS